MQQNTIFQCGERVHIFIDGQNTYAATRALGLELDYTRILEWVRKSGARLVRASYYTALNEEETHNPLRPLVDFLEYNGWRVVTKPAKQFGGKTKGNMHVELTVDALRAAALSDHLLIFTGDGDFRAAIEAIQDIGGRVTVISTLETDAPFVADELRRQADAFVDLTDLQHLITKKAKPAEGPSRTVTELRA